MAFKRVNLLGLAMVMMVVMGSATAQSSSSSSSSPISDQSFAKRLMCELKCSLMCIKVPLIPVCLANCFFTCMHSLVLSETESLCSSKCLNSKGIHLYSGEKKSPSLQDAHLAKEIVSCYDNCKTKSN